MATLKKVNGKKGELSSVMIQDGILMYTKISEERKGAVYEERQLPREKQTRWEYSVDIVVDEDTADEFDEMFPKQTAKKFLKKAFMQQYKIEKDEDFPEGLDSSDKKFFVIKLKQGTHYEEKDKKTKKKTGRWLPFSNELRPRCVELVDGKKTDITLTKEVGNGSVGTVIAKVNSSVQYGESAKLRGILVTDLVEYASGGGNSSEKDEGFEELFGDVEFDELPEASVVEASETKPSTDSSEEFDDEPPFDTEDEFEEDDF